MYKKRKSPERKLIESVIKTYFTFIEFVENPGKSGYMAVLCKVKPEAKDLIKAKLMDSWIKTDKDLVRVRNRMRKIMGYYEDIPDGIKK